MSELTLDLIQHLRSNGGSQPLPMLIQQSLGLNIEGYCAEVSAYLGVPAITQEELYQLKPRYDLLSFCLLYTSPSPRDRG